MVSRRIVTALVVFIVFFSSGNGVFAAQTNESQGPGGYGWQQAWEGSGTSEGWDRVTGSADRQYYDYGYKNITITGRLEDYWAMDCGWWYVSNSAQIDSFKMWDNASDLILTESNVDTSKGVANYSYTWGGSTEGNGYDDPGRWTVQVVEGTVVTQFYIFVRGQLSVTSISTTGSQAGNPVYVNATVKDHAANIMTSSADHPPTVTMYATGAGFADESTMTYEGGGWNATFTPPSPGDYYITVDAGDDHNFWLDGRGRTSISVSGSFPYSFGSSIIKAAVMVLLGFLLLRPGRRAAAFAILILFGIRI